MKRKLLILFLTCVVGWLHPINAQTQDYIVGDGVGYTTNVPYNTYNYATYSQQILTDEQIAFDAGLISKIAFNVKRSNNATRNSVNIYMLHTDKTSFTSNSDWVSITDEYLVYSGPISINTTGWLEITLETQFEYEGGNILICVQDNSMSYTSVKAQFLTNDASNTALTKYADNSNGFHHGSLPEGSRETSNQIKFTWESSAPAVMPSSVPEITSEATHNSVTLAWNAVENAKKYNVYTSTGDLVATVSATSYTIEGLDELTEYCYQVSAVNGEYETGKSIASCATTLEAPETRNIVFKLTDSYGDGWNGGSLKITYHGNETETMTISSGYEYEQTIEIECNTEVRVVYTAGSYASENSFTVSYDDGTIIYSGNYNSNTDKTFIVESLAPKVTVAASAYDIYSDQTATLTATAANFDGNVAYSWSSNGEIVGTDATYTFTPTSTGPFEFTCTATDADNNKASASVTINVFATLAGKQFRVKVMQGTYTGYYLDVQNDNGTIGVETKAERNTQIFTMEYAGSQYYLKTADGYYIKCETGSTWWNVHANNTNDKTPLVFEYTDGEQFYIKDYDKMTGNSQTGDNNPNNCYFKVQDAKVYCDAPINKNDSESHRTVLWSFEECAEEAFQLSLSANNTSVCEGDAVELTATVDGDGTYQYTWTVTEGSGEFSEAAATTYFTPSSAGNCVIKCSVNDGTNTVEKTIQLTVYDVPELTVSPNTFDIDANGVAIIELTYSGQDQPNISNYEIIDEIDSSVANKLVITTKPLKETTELTFKLYNFDSPYGEYDGVYGYLCAAEETVTINVEEALFVELGTENDVTSICEDDANGIQLVATPKFAAGDVINYSWTSETEGALDMLSATNIANPVFTPSVIDEGSLTVTYTCTVNDGVTEASETIDVTIYKKPVFELPASVVVQNGETATIEIVHESYTYVTPVYPDGSDYSNYTLKNSNSADPDTIVFSYVPTTDADLNFEACNENSYSYTIEDYLCKETKTVQVRVVNENKEVVIGNNDESLWSRGYLPVKTDVKYSLTQQIYTASELGINEASEITSISFYTTGKYAQNARNIEIYVAHTDLNTFVDGDPNSTGNASALANDFVNMTGEPNFSGEVTFESGWTEITFTTPFQYEVGKNVILTVNDKTGTTDYTNDYAHYSTGNELRSIVMYNSSAAYDATNITADGYAPNDLKQNNNIKFKYQAIAQAELVAEINVDDAEICDGDNGNRFEMYATRVENATYTWYLVVDGEDQLLEEDIREYTYSNTNPGTYTIKLVVTQNGVSREVTKVLTINPMPNAAVVMGTNGYGFVGEPIGFATTGDHIEGTTYAMIVTVDQVPYNYSSVEYDTHNFEDDGTFYYTVEASIGECETTSTKSIIIYPVATFTAEDACKDQEVVFTNTTLTPNSGGAWNFGEGEGFVWDFGDGTEVASNEETVTHTYTEVGDYNVTLTVTKSGISKVASKTVTVSEIPVAEFNYNGTEALTDITFTATNAGDGANYTWNFGDDTEEVVVNSTEVTHQYALPGEYTVTLTVTRNGCTSTAEQDIEVVVKESGAAIEPEYVDLGSRPANGWMRPYTVNITPDGNTSLTITSLTVEDDNDDYDLIGLSHEGLPVTLEPGEKFPVEVSINILSQEEADFIDVNFNILVNGEVPTNQTEEYTGYCSLYPTGSEEYPQGYGDIFELPLEIDPFSFSEGDEGSIPIEVAGDLHPNYLLPGADEETEYYDAVYKFTLEEAAKLTVTVKDSEGNNTNALTYVYPEDFGGEDGPGLTNYVGYQAPYVPTFEGFSFTLENDPSFSIGNTQGTGWKTGSEGGLVNMYADLDWNTSARYFRSYQSNGENELNYFITTDKYYISENAKLSMSTWVDASNMKYYVFVSEDGYEFTTVQEGVVSSKTAVTVDVDLSEYVGEYYVGIMHVGAESSGGEGNFCLDDITLYEPETRAARASAESSLEIMLEADTYYLVVAATDPYFSVTTNAETLSAPVAANKPKPSYGSTDISTEYEKLSWEFGANTAEYQVLFGTSSTPTEVVVDWNSYVENNYYDLSELGYALEDNTVYYWQVNAKNFAGTTEGQIWYFATPFDAPQNLVLTPTEINLGGTATLTWDAISHASGYKIWKGDEPLTEEPITETTYDIEVLEFSAEPYKIKVEAVYNVDEVTITSKSRTIELTINAEALVEGYVFDYTTSEPLEGATVTYGTDTFTTDADGYYSGTTTAGNYRAAARMSGYNKSEVYVELVPSENAYVQLFYLESTLTMVSNVVATENADKTAVDVEWTFNLEGDPMIETFENGFTYEWETSEDYPWIVVPNGFEENTAGYETYGGYCVKSTNSDYDHDQETGGNREDGDYPLALTTSYLQLTVHIPFNGKIKFDYKLEADTYGGDHGEFYIDEDMQTIYGAGDFTNWETTTYFECDVTAGTHTFTWKYVKDNGWYYGSDAFYIDNISFYENTNVYNVYLKDILADNTTSLVADYATKEFKYEDTSWETREDGIYQWGVSVEYNEPAGDLLNENFEGVEEPETFLADWTKYTEEAEDSYVINNQWHVVETNEYGISACGGTGYSAFVSPLADESVFYFVTPMLNASRQSTLEFDYIIPRHSENFPNDFSKFKVAYSTSQTGPWTDLTAFNKTSVEDWTHATVELPLEEELYIAFIDQNVENWGLGIGLDNVHIHRVAVNGESEIAWSDRIIKGNELIVDGNWNVKENWSRTHTPTAEEVAVISAAGIVNSEVIANTVLVNDGTLTIDETGVLTAQTVMNDDATKLTINAGGQLVHSNEGVMATFVKGIEPYADATINDGWYTISSPLAANIDASEVGGLLGGEFDLYRYDEPTHYWENYEDNTNEDWGNNGALIEKGRGYLYANSANTELSFAGELNVAEVKTSLSVQATKLTGLNLLGNPFAHDIYQGVAFDKDGNLADAHYTLNYHGEWQATLKGSPIKSGAGFLVQAKDGADLTISKTNAQTRAAANAMLVVSVVNNVFEDVAYVSFNDGIGLEKIGHMNEYAPMVYIPGDFNNYAYATVEEDVTEVPVNFEAMTMGEYTIAVKAKNCEYKTMVLVDNLTGEETNLLKDSYTFMATTTDAPDRFVIKLAKDAEVEDSFIYINNGELIFDNLSSDAIINVFDVLGRNIATFNNCGDTTFRVSTDLFADGVYMVRVIEGNNVKVQKMVIE